MTRIFALGLVALLAACGADGEPERPQKGDPMFGVTLSGTAEMGISG